MEEREIYLPFLSKFSPQTRVVKKRRLGGKGGKTFLSGSVIPEHPAKTKGKFKWAPAFKESGATKTRTRLFLVALTSSLWFNNWQWKNLQFPKSHILYPNKKISNEIKLAFPILRVKIKIKNTRSSENDTVIHGWTFYKFKTSISVHWRFWSKQYF